MADFFDTLKARAGVKGEGGGGSSDYNDLTNKPSINGNTLTGNKTPSALGIKENVQADWTEADSTDGAYIKNKPTIPTVNDAVLEIQKNGTKIGEFSANAARGTAVNITVPVTASDVNALPVTTKYGASFVLSIDSSTYVVTATLKDQDGNALGTAQTIDLPLESVVVGGSYDDTTKKVILTLQSGSTVEFSVADLVAGLQSEITSESPLDADLVDDSTSTNKFVTAADKTAWNAKADAATTLSGYGITDAYTKTETDTALAAKQDEITSSAKLSADLVDDSTSTNKFVSASEKSTWNGKQDALTFDTTPTASSTNPVTSGGVKADQDRQDALEAADRAALIQLVDGGAKNRFLPDKTVGTTEIIHGRTFTIQSDMGIKIETTGTVDADADFYLLGAWASRDTLFDAGSETWVPVCSCETKSDDISFRIYNRSTGSTVASRTITSNDNAGISFDFDLTCAFIKIGSAQTIPSGGIVVYPMICTVADYAISQAFVPYRPSWQEMYEMIQALQGNRSASLQSTPALKMGGTEETGETETKEKSILYNDEPEKESSDSEVR